jgi:hypothetical protein
MNINLYSHTQDTILVHKREVLHASGAYHSSSTDGYKLSIAHLVTKVIHVQQESIEKGYYLAKYHHIIQ